MSTTTYTDLKAPFGTVRVAWNEEGVTSVMVGRQLDRQLDPAWKYERDSRHPAAQQMAAYLEGSLREFDLPLVLDGTAFQKKVWRALADIPYGETISYSELAKRVGSPRAVRAVGAANGRNPIGIILPCHRVIGSDGELRGYAGGLDVKRALLDLERGVRPLSAAML